MTKRPESCAVLKIDAIVRNADIMQLTTVNYIPVGYFLNFISSVLRSQSLESVNLFREVSCQVLMH